MRLLSPWDFPGHNTGVGRHVLLQRISPAQGWNPSLPHWQADSLPLSHYVSLLHFCLIQILSSLYTIQLAYPYQANYLKILHVLGYFIYDWWFHLLRDDLLLINEKQWLFSLVFKALQNPSLSYCSQLLTHHPTTKIKQDQLLGFLSSLSSQYLIYSFALETQTFCLNIYGGQMGLSPSRGHPFHDFFKTLKWL